MKGFFIKKAFFDGWDNLIGIVLMNLGYLALLFVLFATFNLAEIGSAAVILGMVGVLFLTAVYTGAVSNAVYGYSKYSRDTWADFKAGFSRNFRHSLVVFASYVFVALVCFFIIPFYLNAFGMVGFALAVVLIWVLVFMALAMPYYCALSSYLPGDRPLKTLKKCFIIMGDNMGFSIFLLLYNIVCLVLTIFTMGLIPGFAGMNLAWHDAVRLLMLKYDYLEENPEADRKHIPWDDILYEEREKVGPRSLRGMIFPWKQ